MGNQKVNLVIIFLLVTLIFLLALRTYAFTLPGDCSTSSGCILNWSASSGFTNGALSAPVTMGAPGYTAATGSVAVQATGNTNSYWQFSLQNMNSTSGSSSDFVSTSDDGTDTTHYADFGMNNSGGGATPFINAHAAYLYSTDNELDLGALGASGVINMTAANGVKINNFASASSTFVCSNGGTLSSCSIAPVVQQAYEGTTQRLNPILINKTAAVAGGAGNVVFNMTADGLSTGASLCPNGTMLNSPNLSVNDATAPYQFSWVWSNSNKTMTVLAQKASGLAVLTFTLLGIPAPVPNGTNVNATIICY